MKYNDFTHGTVENEGSREGIPLPRKVRLTMNVMNKYTEIQEFEFSTLSFETTPLREFTLASYGLPEIGDKPSSRREGNPAFWFFGLAALVLLIALALKYYSARARSKAKT